MTSPNVVVIVVDDLGWRDLGCTGSDFYQTPQIDALAAAGVTFTQAYSAAPNCSPSRASLLTGRAPARIGLTQIVGGHGVGRLADVPSFGQLPRNEYTYARAFRAAGYRTWHVGKWHLGPEHSWPQRHGFDVNVGGCDWGSPRTYLSPYGCPTLDDGPAGEYLTDRLTTEAIALIDKASAERASGADSRPFLLNLWHYAVHTPLQAPSDLVAAQTARAETLGRGADRDIEIGEPLPYWNTTGARVRRRRLQGNPTYAAMISNLDTNVGRVADALRRNAILDDTVVVFTSDNGGLHSNSAPTSNEPLSEGKGWLEEGGLRVPMIIKPACLRDRDAVQGGTTVHTPVSGLDLFPTLLELSGLSQLPERHLDGRSLAGLMTHPGPDIDELSRRALFWHFPHYNYGGASPCSAVRRGRWKLMRRYETATESLFELTSDPGETLNLAATEVSHRADLGRLLDDWLRDVHALVPRPNPSRQFDEYDVGSDGTTYERP